MVSLVTLRTSSDGGCSNENNPLRVYSMFRMSTGCAVEGDDMVSLLHRGAGSGSKHCFDKCFPQARKLCWRKRPCSCSDSSSVFDDFKQPFALWGERSLYMCEALLTTVSARTLRDGKHPVNYFRNRYMLSLIPLYLVTLLSS